MCDQNVHFEYKIPVWKVTRESHDLSVLKDTFNSLETLVSRLLNNFRTW